MFCPRLLSRYRTETLAPAAADDDPTQRGEERGEREKRGRAGRKEEIEEIKRELRRVMMGRI